MSCNAADITNYLDSNGSVTDEEDAEDAKEDIPWSGLNIQGWKYKAVDQFSGKNKLTSNSRRCSATRFIDC